MPARFLRSSSVCARRCTPSPAVSGDAAPVRQHLGDVGFSAGEARRLDGSAPGGADRNRRTHQRGYRQLYPGGRGAGRSGVRCGRPGPLRLDPVADDPLVLIVPPARPLAEKEEVAFAAVLNEPLVALYQTSALQQHIEQHAAELGQALNVRVRMSHFAGLCEMVAHGAGGAILPRVIAERYRQRYSFAVIGLQDRWAQRRLCLCYQDDASLSPAMRRLLEWLRQP